MCDGFTLWHMKNKNHLTSLCLVLSQTNDGHVPDWVEVIPAGVNVKGLDGRQWLNDQPQGILNHFTELKQAGRELVFDFEHSTELKAPNGDQAPASGWGVDMQQRDNGSIWVKVDWNELGRNSIAGKEYRYLSPVLIYEKSTNRIVGIQSVALTNKANLLVAALNQQESITETPMDLAKLLAVLGLAATANFEDAIKAINDLKAAEETKEGELVVANNRANNPPLDKFVPRSDYDTALNQASAATRKLAEIEQKQLAGEIETVINHALAAGKITPATKEYHVANCQQAGGLERFKAFVASAPEIGGASGLGDRKPPDQDIALNTEQKAIADVFGNSVEDIKKYGAV
jgi:phage I-like protein